MKKRICFLVLLLTFAAPCQEQMRLAVLEPEGKGLSKDEQWMLSLVQSSIAADFNKYSPIEIIVCPKGWHLPSSVEWDILTVSVDGDKYLKTTSGWEKNGNGTDAYGLSALPGGEGYDGGNYFSNVGSSGKWWSSSEYDSDNAYYRFMAYGYDDATCRYDGKSSLRSIRCVKD
jgi:uncharacterized protein (TIGR02145 family)